MTQSIDVLAGQGPARQAAGVALAILLACTASAAEQATQSPTPGTNSCSRCEAVAELLQRAGASSDDTHQIDKELREAPTDASIGYEAYLRNKTSAEIVKLLEVKQADDRYTPGPDSQPQAGVPQGKTFEFAFDRSAVFPGTSRTITVYVPAQYRGNAPACLYVGLDGLWFNAPIVFDNLIHKGEMPVTIAVGVPPGTVDSASTAVNPRFNRSFEFDGMSGNLARFLLEEVLPEVERRKTPDGLPILLSKDPNDRAAGGASTGGIGSFTLAWERPDSFHRVFSAVGTFVGMRGGDHYPVLVRKTEPKPIRIFMQDGANDNMDGTLGEVGNWWASNLNMLSAFEFAGYSVEHIWGEGGHNLKHGTVVFPDGMRWLWRDWPKPIIAGESKNVFLRSTLLPGETWQPTSEADREARHLLSEARRNHIQVAQGREYWVQTYNERRRRGEVWLKQSNGRSILLDTDLQRPTGIALSPDGLWLAVAESGTHWGYSYRVERNGTVQHKQRFYWFHVPDTADDSGAGNWVFDREGRLYGATRLGVQIFDRNGRSRAILPAPDGTPLAAIAFGGPQLNVLHIETVKGKRYRRTLKVSGLPPGAEAIKLPEGSAP